MCASSALALDPPITYEAEVSGSVSGGKHTPFWLAANKQGLGSVLKNTGYVRAAAFRDALTDKKFGWGFGADIAGSWRAEAPFQIRQLYADVRGARPGLVSGVQLSHVKLTTRKQDTVIFYVLETYEVFRSGQQAA